MVIAGVHDAGSIGKMFVGEGVRLVVWRLGQEEEVLSAGIDDVHLAEGIRLTGQGTWIANTGV